MHLTKDINKASVAKLHPFDLYKIKAFTFNKIKIACLLKEGIAYITLINKEISDDLS